MRIAVNTRFLIKGKMEGIGWYTHELLRRMVVAHPEVEFHFLFDRPFDPDFIYGPNVVPHILRPPARHPVLWYIWFEFAVPRALARIKPDLFWSPDNFLSLRTKVPTVLTCHDLIPFQYPEGIPNLVRKYYHKYWPKYLRKAKHLVAISESTKTAIQELFSVPASRISVIHNGVREGFSRLRQISPEALPSDIPSLTTTESTNKSQPSKPYFIATGSIHPRKNTLRLIQAFELFKRNTGLPHQLVLVGRMSWKTTEIETAIASSPFASDLICTGYLPDQELQNLTAQAEAMVYISLMEGFGLPILEAMQAAVPVITSNCSAMPEVAGNAAILVSPTDLSAIAWAMEKVVTDQTIREQLIALGTKRCAQFSWDRAAEQLFAVLIKTAKP